MALVDRTYLEVEGETIVCDSIDEDFDPDTKPVEAMTRNNRILGYSGGCPKLKITANLPKDVDSDVNWFELAKNRTLFSAHIEEEEGTSRTYTDCCVMKVGTKSKSGDHVGLSLDIHAIDMVED